MIITNLFVYGTLRPGMQRADLLYGCKELGIGKIKGKLFDLGPFPTVAALPEGDKAGHFVVGNVLDMSTHPNPNTLLEVLDRIENIRSGMYNRVAVTAKTNDGKEYVCWVYVNGDLDLSRARLIEKGDYLCYVTEKQSSGALSR